MSTSGVLEQLTTRLRAEGLGVTCRLALRRAGQAVWLHELHVWLFMRLDEPRPRPPLLPGLVVRRLGNDPARTWSDEGAFNVAAVAALGVNVNSAIDRLHRGHQLFVAFDDADRPAGLVWAFLGECPTVVAAGGWLPLPAGTVNVEDSVVAAEQRGRGLAPGLYNQVFEQLAGQGVESVVGKIEVGNTANLRACAKVGWPGVAIIELVKVGGWRRVRVIPCSPRSTTWLAEAINEHNQHHRRR